MGQTESNFDDDALIMEDDLDANLITFMLLNNRRHHRQPSVTWQPNDEALENIFKEIDVDDSKSIDLSEFKAFTMKKRPKHM